jgi:hypothetical protein
VRIRDVLGVVGEEVLTYSSDIRVLAFCGIMIN